MGPSNIVDFEAMLIGYTDALHRLDAASLNRDPVGTYVPLFEALNWAQAMDERVQKTWTPDGKPAKWGWRDRIPSGDLMGGVSFVRNSVHHDWSDAVVLRDHGVTFDLTFPVSFTSGTGKPWGWYWRDADQLPPPGKKPWAENERVYRDQLQGASVRQTLDVLGGVFLTLKTLREPLHVSPGQWSDLPPAEDGEAEGDNPPD